MSQERLNALLIKGLRLVMVRRATSRKMPDCISCLHVDRAEAQRIQPSRQRWVLRGPSQHTPLVIGQPNNIRSRIRGGSTIVTRIEITTQGR